MNFTKKLSRMFGRNSAKEPKTYQPYVTPVATHITRIKASITSASWRDEYAPPELQNARKDAVLTGFQKDAMHLLVRPLEQKLAEAKRNFEDFTNADLADAMAAVYHKQPNESFGFFIRTTIREYLTTNLPDQAVKLARGNTRPQGPAPKR